MKIKQILASLLVLAGTALGQGQFNGGGIGAILNPSQVGSVPFVDGINNANIQSIYNNTTFQGGEVHWNPPAGTTATYLADIFQNRTIPVAPIVTLTTTCGGVNQFLTGNSSKFLAVQQVQYSSNGDTDWSPVTQIQETTTGSLCYTVSPSNAIFGGNNSGNNAGYMTLAQECTGACPLPLTAPTIQYATTSGQLFWYFVDASTTRTYNLTTAATAIGATGIPAGFSPNFMPIPNNGGVCVLYTHLILGGQSQNSGNFIIFPFEMCQGDSIVGQGRKVTNLQLSQSAPNGIPYFQPKAVVNSTNGTQLETVGNVRTFVLALTEQFTAGTVVITSLSPSYGTAPLFGTYGGSAFRSVTLNVPGVPYLPQGEQLATQYLVGSRVTDNGGTPSVWQVTTAGTTNNTGIAAGACASEGVTTVNDGPTWKCVLKGVSAANAAGAAIPAQGEVYDSGSGNLGYWEAEVACTAGSPINFPNNSNIGRLFTDSGGCLWVFLGRTTMVRPGYEVFSASGTPTITLQYGNAAPALDTTICATGTACVAAGAVSNASNWSGCSPTYISAANCGTGVTANSISNFTLHTFSVALPTPTASGVTCPVGINNCQTTGGVTFRLYLHWTTPEGVSPIESAAITVTPTLGQAINIPWSGVLAALTPPNNATGWTVSGCSGVGCPPVLQAVDGYNNGCGTGAVLNTPAGYTQTGLANAAGVSTPAYAHQGSCAIGQDMYIFNPLTVQPNPPFHGATDNFAMIGQTGNGSQKGIPFGTANTTLTCYSCRIDNLTMEMGRSLNTIEPYGNVVLQQVGQEGSGVGTDAGCVQLSDGGNTGLYVYSAGSQNTGDNCVHWTGQPWDYTYGEILENVASPRRFSNFTMLGPLQGTPWMANAGILVVNPPGNNGAGQAAMIDISDAESEMSYYGIDIENAAAVITNIWSSNQSSRSVPFTINIGLYAHDVVISGIRNASSSGPTIVGCPIKNESPSALNPAVCDTTQQLVAGYSFGNNGGIGGLTGMPICTTDPLEGCGNPPTTGVPFASLGPAVLGQTKFCNNCVATTPATCPGTAASCVCTSGTGSMWARAENFGNNGLNWYCGD